MRKTYLVLLLILVLAFVLRLPTLLNRGGFWLDEVVSIEVAQKSITESVKYLVWENNPPLHYWLLHFWGLLFDYRELATRLLSVLINLLAIVFTYLLARKLFTSKLVGYLSAFFVAISYFHIFLSTEARMYPLVYLLAVLSLYYFYNFLQTKKNKDLIFYILFTTLAYYTHLTAFYLFFIVNVFFVYYYCHPERSEEPALSLPKGSPANAGRTLPYIRGRFFVPDSHRGTQNDKVVKRWLIAQVITLVLFLPWLVTFLVTKLVTFNRQAWYFYTDYQGFYFWFQTKQFLDFASSQVFIEFILLIIFLVSLGLFLFRISWRDKKVTVENNLNEKKIFVLLIYLIPLIIGFVINITITKYFVIASLGLYLILASGLAAVFNKLKKDFHKVIFVFIILTLILSNVLSNFNISVANWPLLASYIKDKEQDFDVILTIPYLISLPFRHYYHGNSKIIGLPTVNDDLLLQTIKSNWQIGITEEELRGLEEKLISYKRVFLISGKTKTALKDDLAFLWFLKNNWQYIELKTFSGVDDYKVVLFKKGTE